MGILTPAACLLGGAFVDFYCIGIRLRSHDLMKEIAPMERDWIIALFKFPITPHLLPTWESGA